MRKTTGGRAMLLEILISMIFLALSVCVCVLLFSAGRNHVTLSEKKTQALLLCQDSVEQILAGGEKAVTADERFALNADGQYEMRENELLIRVDAQKDNRMLTGTVSAYDGETVLISLPFGKYEAEK